MRDESFKDFVLDQLEEVPNIRAQGMFDGFGLYAGKKFFGIIWKSGLYFKTDSTTRERYISAGMKPFAPSKKQILKNYFEVPVDTLENRESLIEWVLEAISLARDKR